ncbi:MAG TPA: hypothetical protein VGF48_13240 [Thermoanaerobaculia bacterium]|jgi:hypothetical protein
MKPIRHLLLLTVLVASFPVLAQSLRVYHETWCPAVDPSSMTRIKRATAVQAGQIPAADCHPNGPVRYLGMLLYGPGEPTRTTSIESHVRPSSDQSDRPKTVSVDGYMRGGTWVDPYMRSAPRH